MSSNTFSSDARTYQAPPCRALTVIALLMITCGCDTTLLTRGPAPVGPGAATKTNLRPWVIDQPTTAYVGRLENFLVASQTGCYATWSLIPTGPHVGSEVDIRACAADAQRYRDQRVLIHGKLIDRGDRHLPLFVAERITPIDAPPTVIVTRPVTDQRTAFASSP